VRESRVTAMEKELLSERLLCVVSALLVLLVAFRLDRPNGWLNLQPPFVQFWPNLHGVLFSPRFLLLLCIGARKSDTLD
jgi:hypothetical protein